ncbi:unnamed protein product [Amoebophrya sp. A120]|nr:unnamed protein product [Amoebophrya sp. A120]|eukprot:GSA120T00023334001.1
MAEGTAIDPADQTQLDYKAQPPKVRFRNYYPKTPALQAGVQQRLTTTEIEQQIDSILEANQEALDKKDWMAPTASKKNWDIKRDFTRKLQKLEKRTETAMVKLIRKQLLESQGKAAAATAQTEEEEKQLTEEALLSGSKASGSSLKQDILQEEDRIRNGSSAAGSSSSRAPNQVDVEMPDANEDGDVRQDGSEAMKQFGRQLAEMRDEDLLSDSD